MKKKLFLSLLVLSLFLSIHGFCLSENENVYLLSVKCQVRIYVNKEKEKMDRVKERKDGRWVYTDKMVKYNEKEIEFKPVELTDAVEAESQNDAKKKYIEILKSRNYQNIKITKIQQVK